MNAGSVGVVAIAAVTETRVRWCAWGVMTRRPRRVGKRDLTAAETKSVAGIRVRALEVFGRSSGSCLDRGDCSLWSGTVCEEKAEGQRVQGVARRETTLQLKGTQRLVMI
mmetsp:Transcript_5974/g.19866  ORF Transcript_5974/g.19866 Transcript_5974/m.19866 type:complete len:110 (+) Transcript_5974:385-714(+)